MDAETPATVRPCDLCGSVEHFILPEAALHGSGGVSVCANCGFVHVKARRSAAEIAKSWEAIYEGKGYTSKWAAVEARLTYVAEFYGQLYGWAGKSVLELGAGEGRFLQMVRDRGAYPVGLEPSGAGCQALRSKDIFAHHGTIEQCGTVGTFDVVVIAWTLENCQDCLGMLKAARAMLLPGGHVLIATGSRILVPYKKPISTYFSNNPPDCHAFRFSNNTLTLAQRRSGLEVVAMNSYRENDWLVSVATRTESAFPATAYGGDRPLEVLDFFHSWARAFP